MRDTKSLYLFRMLHFTNVPHALKHGLWTADSLNANPNYTPIGDRTIIVARHDMEVPVSPGGHLSEYIPFYFAARAPMLYVIKNGFNGVRQTPQNEIVYLVTPFETITQSSQNWCFTDGNARDFSSHYYNSIKDLDKIDWKTVQSEVWHNTEEDHDVKRRKQAEFLVKETVPADCISHIIVYDEEKLNFVKQIVQQLGLQVKVAASPKHYY